MHVRQLEARFEVSGVLLDELKQPITGAEVRLLGPVGVEGCTSTGARTNRDGGFCLTLSEFGRHNQLLFSGNAHFDSVKQPLDTQPTAESSTPEFSIRTPTEWPLSAATQEVIFTSHNVPASGRPQVSLTFEHENGVQLLVAPEALTGAFLKRDIPRAALPAAGRATLRGTLSLASPATELTQTLAITVTAKVTVVPTDAPARLRSNDTFTLDFAVEGDVLPISSGWVELLADGRSVGLGPVREGQAQVSGKLQSARKRTVELTAQFVPAFPWHHPAPPRVFSVTLLGPLPWAHIPWALLALAATLWVVRTWRRPSRPLTPKQQTQKKVEIGIRVSGRPGDDNAWRGLVLDAHTGDAIVNAHVALVAPSLSAAPPLNETWTGLDGTFVLPRQGSVPEGARLTIDADQYTTLKQTVPQPCELEVGLVSRRRTLLHLLQHWARSKAGPLTHEVTPQAVAHEARHRDQLEVEQWALDLDAAAFGPRPPSADEEADLVARLPPGDRSPPRGR